MKERIKWLLDIAEVKPLLFSVALLLIAVASLSVVIENRDRKLDDCNSEKALIQQYYNDKIDSLSVYYRAREIVLNEEVKKTLNAIIDDYKRQLQEQKNINNKVNTTIDKNQKIIDINKQKIKNLKNEG